MTNAAAREPESCAAPRDKREWLKQGESRIAILSEVCFDGVFLVDPADWRMIEGNGTGLDLLGYTAEELGRLKVDDIFPDVAPASLAKEKTADISAERRGREATCRVKSGELVPVRLLVSRTTVGRRAVVLLVLQDLREHRLAQLGLAVSKIAHDLRGILATAQIVADQVAESCNSDCQRITPRLISAIDRAATMCSDTLTFGRASQRPPRLAAFGLHALVEDVGRISRAATTPEITMRNEIAPDFTLIADADQVFRALFNLVQNACKVLRTCGGGEIRINAASCKDRIFITVADTGPGVAPQVRARLFEPFATFGRKSSTGLGLAIVREIMQAHGGDVTLASAEGEGATFRLEFPHRSDS